MKISEIKELMEEFERAQIHKMKIKTEDVELELEKEGSVLVETTQPATEPIIKPEPKASQAPESTGLDTEHVGTEVKSPLVGVFYSASSPDAEPYVKVGDHVEEGQVLCIIEAMKVMNEIKSPVSGTIKAILASAQDMVEFDQALMIIE